MMKYMHLILVQHRHLGSLQRQGKTFCSLRDYYLHEVTVYLHLFVVLGIKSIPFGSCKLKQVKVRCLGCYSS